MDRFEDAKLRIKEGTDLVALIEQYLPLRQRGRTLVALCPFHPESTPSFTVDRERQFYRCYGCGKTGDVFTWLEERDGLTFREAMEQLAERCGVSLEGVFKKGQSQQQRQQVRTAHEVLGAVADWFHRSLLGNGAEPAQQYLEQRGLDDAMAAWQLGFHPEGGRELQQFAKEQKLPFEVLEQAGLLRNGREIFAGRLIFPILDERGRTVAFGGRVVPGTRSGEPRGDYKPPKYLNSPESPFFSKRRVLYGLRAAKQAGERRLIVMEGYTDVIACHLAGFAGAVASLGTAFTADHARMVERYADQGVVLMFDGDRAGKQAAERAHRELLNCQLLVRIAMVSEGGDGAKDPADVVLARPGEEEELVLERRARFADTLDGAQDALSVWFRLLRQRLDLRQAVNVEAAARECATLLEQVEVPVRREALAEQMARHLAVPTPSLKRLLRDRGRGRHDDQPPHEPVPDEIADYGVPHGGTHGASSGRPSLLESTENTMLSCVLAQPTLLVDLDLDESPLQVEAVRQLFEWAVEGLAVGRESGAEMFRYLFSRAAEQPHLQAVLAAAQDRADGMRDAAEVLNGLVEGRRRRRGEVDRRGLREQLQQALASGDRELAAELQAQLLDNLRASRPRTRSGAARRSVAASDGSANPWAKDDDEYSGSDSHSENNTHTDHGAGN